MPHHTSDTRIIGYEPLLAPAALLAELPLGASRETTVEQGRAAGVGAGANLVVLVEVRVQRVEPGVGVPAVVGIELAQLLVVAQRGQLDPAEQRVADQDPEGPDVAGDRGRPPRRRPA